MQIPSHIETRIRQQVKKGKTFNAYIYDTAPLKRRINCLKRIMPQGVEVFYVSNRKAQFCAI